MACVFARYDLHLSLGGECQVSVNQVLCTELHIWRLLVMWWLKSCRFLLIGLLQCTECWNTQNQIHHRRVAGVFVLWTQPYLGVVAGVDVFDTAWPSLGVLADASVLWHSPNLDVLAGVSVLWHSPTLGVVAGVSVLWHSQSLGVLAGVSVLCCCWC